MNRHHRQQILPQIGEAAQHNLANAHALIVGVGALGTVIAESLTRAGVGTLTLVDRDIVELTNLQRQTLYTEQDARDATPKPIAAQQRLNQIDSSTTINALCEDFSPSTAPDILGFHHDSDSLHEPSSASPLPEGEGPGERAGVRGSSQPPLPSPRGRGAGGEGASPSPPPPPHLLLDGTDNFETRYLLNDIAISQNIPYICAGTVGTQGTLLTINPPHSPCLRCLFPQLPAPGSEPTCDTAGVLGPAVGAIANLAAAEAIKLLSGNHPPNPNLIHLDAWAPSFRTIDISNSKDPNCPCCAHHRFDFLDATAGEITSLCGRRSVQIAPAARGTIELTKLAQRLAPFGSFTESNNTLQGAFKTETGEHGPITLHVFPTGRTIIGGTTDQARAKTIYTKFISS